MDSDLFRLFFVQNKLLLTKTRSNGNLNFELHGVPRSALSRVIKEFITRDKVHRNTFMGNGELRAPET